LPNNEDGEFELVLGNRQLVSVFLIIVVLLGVFFSMGYIVGRNSAPVLASEASRNTAASKPIVVEHPRMAENGAAGEEQPAAIQSAKPSPAPPPAQHAPAPAPTKEEKAAEPPRTGVTAEPAAGEYWQVVATTRPDAEIISEALAKKGFRSLVAPAPKDGLFRVLVGPQKDNAAMAQARTELEAAGFKNPLVRKY
jgi:cell division protein FtsN